MLVIGNGESRKDVDIDVLQTIKVGCNAIIRDYHVHHLICCDKKMVSEAITNNRISNKNIYTRSDWQNLFPGVSMVPELWYKSEERIDQPWHWGSGDYAVLLASELAKGQTIHLIGFDLYSTDSNVNNVYKDTQNYNKSDSRSVDPSYWIYHLAKIFDHYSQNQYIIYPHFKNLPKSWQNFGNVSTQSLDHLESNINNNS